MNNESILGGVGFEKLENISFLKNNISGLTVKITFCLGF
jgi:hypothetical protein